MTEYYDIAFKFPVVGVAPKLVLDELADLATGLVDINLDTLKIGDTEGYVEGHYYEGDWDVIVAVCEANEAVKIDYEMIAEWINETDGEGDE